MSRLNQIIAVEKGVKAKVTADLGEAYKLVQKPALFGGFTKEYSRLGEDGEMFPSESQRVQYNAQELLRSAVTRATELLDVTATKDFANCTATADVVVDGTVVVAKAPVTYLLFLEKQLTDLHTFVGKLPTLSPEEKWSFDEAAGVYKSEPGQTTKTKKAQKPIVMYAATKEHPAQTQLITEDVVVGHWSQVKMSGAVPESRRRTLLERLEKVQKAVKYAREQANMVDAPEQKVGEKLLSWLTA
jgi:hypothetical protein